ncbi:MAG: DUF2304 family protein [bacterium]
MIQEIFALIVIAFFIIKLFWQKQKKQIQRNEFIVWLIFWLIAALLIIFLKQIDQLVSGLGFTGTGIQVIFYFGIVLLFYLIFRIRLRLARIEKNITKIVEKTAKE